MLNEREITIRKKVGLVKMLVCDELPAGWVVSSFYVDCRDTRVKYYKVHEDKSRFTPPNGRKSSFMEESKVSHLPKQ